MGKRMGDKNQQAEMQKQQLEQSATPNSVGRGDAVAIDGKNDQAPVPPGTPVAPPDQDGNIVRQSGMIAKKDFHIVQNDFDKTIKAGDDLSDIPAEYHDNLRAEGVIE